MGCLRTFEENPESEDDAVLALVSAATAKKHRAASGVQVLQPP